MDICIYIYTYYIYIYTHTCYYICMYIYIYIYMTSGAFAGRQEDGAGPPLLLRVPADTDLATETKTTADFPTNIVDFTGFISSIILI